MSSIESHPDAIEGSVTHLSHYDATTFAPTSAILCRNTEPLISFAFRLLARGVPCKVLGREIGQSLITTVNQRKASNLPELRLKLTRFFDRAIAKATDEENLVLAANLTDRWRCLTVFIDQVNSIPELISKIESMFSDTITNVVTLSTVHKAKGLEWPTVFILDFDKYMPSKWAKSDTARKQERNLCYVAVTRAQDHLVYIKSGCWVRPDNKEETADEAAIADE